MQMESKSEPSDGPKSRVDRNLMDTYSPRHRSSRTFVLLSSPYANDDKKLHDKPSGSMDRMPDLARWSLY
jgi:hypothetical protein